MNLLFEGINNIRDLGGIAVSGGRVREGLLLRAARLSEATDADISRLCKMGLRHIVDFRDVSEIDENPDREVTGAQHHHLPALKPMSGKIGMSLNKITASETLEKFKSIYRYMAQGDNASTAYTGFFEILKKSDGTVLWHCTQGKDRTGIASMLLLSALGAHRDEIYEDYFRSNAEMQKLFDKAKSDGADEERLLRLRQYLFVSEEVIDTYFETMRTEHGGVMDYLKNILGIDSGDIELLREKYTQG